MFSRIPNLRIHEFFSQFFSCFLLKQGRIFLLRSKMLLKLFILKNRHFPGPLRENKTFFVNKIRGFVDSEFVKTCHEHVNNLHTSWQSDSSEPSLQSESPSHFFSMEMQSPFSQVHWSYGSHAEESRTENYNWADKFWGIWGIFGQTVYKKLSFYIEGILYSIFI